MPPAQQLYQSPPQNGSIERATDPRKPPADTYAVTDNDNDLDTEFARTGGAMVRQEYDVSSRDETPIKDSRPNPNKHEDG